MFQTGDPTCTSKCGNSCWGETIEDEELKHSVRGLEFC